MRLTGKIQVPPLGEDRMTRIERRIVAGAGERLADPVRGPRRSLGLAAAVAFAAGAALAAWHLGHRPAPVAPPVAQVITVHGGALALGDATITGDAAASYRVARTGRDLTVTLDRGTLALAVEHDPGRRFVVRAGDTEVEDVGTTFTVAYDGARVDVRVAEGEVRVSRQQRAELITAGHAWSSAPRVAMAAPPTSPAATGLAAPPTTPADRAPPAAADRRAAPRVAAPGDDAEARAVALHGRVAAVPRVRAPDDASGHGAARAASTAAAERAAAAAAANPYVDLAVAIRRQPIDFDPQIDGRNDAAAEIARLKEVAYSPRAVGAEASQAIYRIAILLEEPLHQDSEALRTLDMYLRRFSGGREYRAALWLRVRITCLHAFDDTCRQAAYSYQHEVPAGPRTDLAVRITNAQ